MKYMLDTNICIYIIKNKPPKVKEKLLRIDPKDICISSITYSELIYGVEKSNEIDRNRIALILFLSSISILDYDKKASDCYGKIRPSLENKGTPIGPLDTLIAAHAKSLNLCLVTNNTKEFQNIKNLKIEDWA